jgi:hypothetical protein
MGSYGTGAYCTKTGFRVSFIFQVRPLLIGCLPLLKTLLIGPRFEFHTCGNISWSLAFMSVFLSVGPIYPHIPSVP